MELLLQYPPTWILEVTASASALRDRGDMEAHGKRTLAREDLGRCVRLRARVEGGLRPPNLHRQVGERRLGQGAGHGNRTHVHAAIADVGGPVLGTY